ncbi:uncharacterized protein LOC131176025 [Hevea brasiliensis]|uniref:uncharacterized protein LOC131176025 n=1 Tax=Hevea brasiliensis TaxID=3981 RepID=UPI0025CE8777|nr:uncharacterized protein LOC131176025 [Hevea brasiliensis]
MHSEERAKKFKALSTIHASVTDVIFTRVMTCETAKQAWDKLKEEYQGTDRTRLIQMLNLWRAFEVLKMKDVETIKDYTDRLMKFVNQLRLIGEELSNKRIMQKVLVSVLDRFKSKISTVEEKDPSQITLAEVINAFQAVEQRRTIRLEDANEVAFQAKVKDKDSSGNGGKKQSGERKEKDKKDGDGSRNGRKGKFPPCHHYKKSSHTENYCWYRPNLKCRACNQLRHVEKVCKNKGNQQGQQAQVVDNQDQVEKKLFVAACHATNSGKGSWLVGSGCTSHMISDAGIFRHLDRTYYSRVKMGNGEHLEVKGKGVAQVETPSEVFANKKAFNTS